MRISTPSRRFVRRAAQIMIAAGAANVAAASFAVAQDSSSCMMCQPPRHERQPSEFEKRSSGGVAFMQARPIGDLAANIGFGYGGIGTYLFRLDHAGVIGLRGDVGFAVYGTESERVPLSPTIGGRIQVKVSTDNYIVPFTIGPQLTYPDGRFRPYVNAGFGGQAFFTQSHVSGDDNAGSIASTTNQSDATHTWVLGGGAYFPVYLGRTHVSVDLGAQYYTGGHAQYLRPGSIQDLPNSQISITPLESDTHMLLVRIGVHIGG